MEKVLTVNVKDLLETPLVCTDGEILQTGFIPDSEAIFDSLNHLNWKFNDRAEAEQNKEWKQIIPYVLLFSGSMFFHYSRMKQSGEGRLVGKTSIGIGGHINPDDASNLVSNHNLALTSAVRIAAKRELDEEVSFIPAGGMNFIGVLNDDSNDVGLVHLGFVYLQRVVGFGVHPKEPSIGNPAWSNLPQLQTFENLEGWSKHLVDSNFISKWIG